MLARYREAIQPSAGELEGVRRDVADPDATYNAVLNEWLELDLDMSGASVANAMLLVFVLVPRWAWIRQRFAKSANERRGDGSAHVSASRQPCDPVRDTHSSTRSSPR